MSRSGAMVQHRYFLSVIRPLNRGFYTLEAAFYFVFKFRSNWALISRSGPMVRHRYIQSVIEPLNRGSIT